MAASAVRFEWAQNGIQGTIGRLQEFKTRLRRKVLTGVGRASSKVVLQAMRGTVPVAKKDYGPGGELKKALAAKIRVYRSGLVLWWGVGPRTSWEKDSPRKFRFWRDPKTGKVHKAPIAWSRHEQPSRRAHLSERVSHYIARAVAQAQSRADAAGQEVLAQAMAET